MYYKYLSMNKEADREGDPQAREAKVLERFTIHRTPTPDEVLTMVKKVSRLEVTWKLPGVSGDTLLFRHGPLYPRSGRKPWLLG